MGKSMARADIEDGWVQWADTLGMMSLRRGEWNFRSQLHSVSGDIIGVEICTLPWTRKPTAWFLLSPWWWWRDDHDYVGMGLRIRGPSSWPSDPNSFLLALMGISVVWVLGSTWTSKNSASNLVHTSILWPLESFLPHSFRFYLCVGGNRKPRYSVHLAGRQQGFLLSPCTEVGVECPQHAVIISPDRGT